MIGKEFIRLGMGTTSIDNFKEFKEGCIIRIILISNNVNKKNERNKIVSVNGIVINVMEKFITVLYLTPDLKRSDKRLPLIEVENNTYRVTPILFYVFKNYYKYVDVITTIDKELLDFIKFTTIEPTMDMDKLSYKLKKFYKREIDKYLSIFYDIMVGSIVKYDT
jgi:hypothetical protein